MIGNTISIFTTLVIGVLLLGTFATTSAQTIYQDGFESGQFDPNFWTPQPSIDGAQDGVVDLTGNARTGTFAVYMGRSTDGEFTTNALDLRLDLSSHNQVELRFWLFDVTDEAQDGDGLYFSDDDGENFVQVLPFDIENLNEEPDVYADYPPIDVDALAAANDLLLTSTFVIRFQQVGSKDIITSGGRDGFMIDDVSVVVPQTLYTTLPFTDGFETGEFGPMWHEANASEPAVGLPTAPGFAPARRGGVVDLTGNARTGTFGVFMGRSTDGEFTTNALDLRLDLSSHNQVELRFWLFDVTDEAQDGDGLYFSDDDGENFVQVLSFDIENLNEEPDVYADYPPIDVDALAAANDLLLTSTFVIRFQQVGSKDIITSGGRDGFMIDDVSVVVPQTEYTGLTVPTQDGQSTVYKFEDGFETGEFGQMWHEAYTSEPAVGTPTAPGFAPARRGGVVDMTGNPRMGTFAVFMGRSTDGEFTTNALDLRLNFEGQSEIELRFWLLDVTDETQQGDGIFFSDNGGDSFVQVVELDPSNQADDYSEEVYDVDSLAAANGLMLTSTFVIRFQQVGSKDRITSGGRDGFMIDDISVTGDVMTEAITVAIEDAPMPKQFILGSNYPNPFNPNTTIPFTLEQASRVHLSVYDMLGREVAVLLDTYLSAGDQKVQFTNSNLTSGIYFYRLTLEGRSEVRQMTLVK